MKLSAKLLAVTGIGVAVVISFYVYFAFLLPLPDLLRVPAQISTTKIYDRNGVLLYEILDPLEGKKTTIEFGKIPLFVKQATIAAEDSNFYSHGGIDFLALLRAIYQNTSQGRIVSGGSTIPQQLIRNIFTRQKVVAGVETTRGFVDKLAEMAFAFRLSHEYSKDEILEMYLNTIYYGNLAYGVESAALDYFGKHVYDLDLAECAMLAGLPQSPSLYNPYENLAQAKQRQAYVLDQMRENNFIGEDEAEAAKKENIKFRKNNFQIKAPHFVQNVIAELEDKYGAEMVHYGGLSVTTTLDYSLQLLAEQTIERRLAALTEKKVGNGALVAVDVVNGQILSWVGSRDYFDDKIDGAVDMITSLRQPGSSIKPFTYLAAFERGWNPATIIADISTQFTTDAGPYTPKNYDLKFHGPVRARMALASSYNVPAVKTLEFVGVGNFINFLKRFGINTLNHEPSFYGLALTLGGGEVRPIDMAKAYLGLANLGEKKELVKILEVDDREGNVKWKNMGSEPGAYLLGENGRQHAFQIIDIMSDDNARLPGFGEGSVLEIGRPAAVKTGTTRNFRDNWTVGFTPQLLTVVWVGNADGEEMTGISGVDGAGPIWHDFMVRALEDKPKLEFERPRNLSEVEICGASGKLPTDLCPERFFEWFVRGTEPKERDDVYQKIKIDRARNVVVSDNCLKIDPTINYEEEVFEIYPPMFQQWLEDNGVPQPPRRKCESIYGIGTEDETGRLGEATADLRPIVSNPLNNDSFLLDATIPLENQKISFQAIAPNDVQWVEWWLNGKNLRLVGGDKNEVAQPFSMKWPMQRGEFELWVVDSAGRRSESVKFEVK